MEFTILYKDAVTTAISSTLGAVQIHQTQELDDKIAYAIAQEVVGMNVIQHQPCLIWTNLLRTNSSSSTIGQL